jgi:hypothetical protein
MYSEIIKDCHVLFLKKGDDFLKGSYSRKVYNLLEKAYKTCGGINTGNGFKNESDMIKNIPIWRLTFSCNELVSVMMLKQNPFGYKMVAYAPSAEIDPEIRDSDLDYMMHNSYGELSGALLVVVLKHLGSKWKNYIINFETLLTSKKPQLLLDFIINNRIPINSVKMYDRMSKQWPKLLDYCYLRQIGDEYKMKVILGTIL